MTRPPESRTTRVTDTSLPSTGHSVRSRVPAGIELVFTDVSKPRTTLLTFGRLSETVRPFGTDQISNRTTPGDAKPRIRMMFGVSFRNRIVWEPETVASSPSG